MLLSPYGCDALSHQIWINFLSQISSGHLHMVVMHLSTKFGANNFVQSADTDIFQNSIRYLHQNQVVAEQQIRHRQQMYSVVIAIGYKPAPDSAHHVTTSCHSQGSIHCYTATATARPQYTAALLAEYISTSLFLVLQE